jgi:hypothetical protein
MRHERGDPIKTKFDVLDEVYVKGVDKGKVFQVVVTLERGTRFEYRSVKYKVGYYPHSAGGYESFGMFPEHELMSAPEYRLHKHTREAVERQVKNKKVKRKQEKENVSE